MVRFLVPAANTAAVSLNLDGLGAKPVKTPTGAELPAGYLRANVPTVATYSGAEWIASRAPERGGNANGQFLRLENGYQRCWHSLTMSGSADTAWTFPAAFVSAALIAITGSHVSGSTSAVMVSFADPTTTGVEASLYNTSAARVAQSIRPVAEGWWY